MDDESNVLERAAAWQRSIEERDVDAAGTFLDDDYALELVEPEAAVFRREAWLGMLPDYVVSAYDVLERFVDIDGDVAVVLQRVRMTATVRGADRSGPFVLTDIWRRRNGEWRVWRRTSTPLSAGAMPGG
jgi:ketosteroid isomerase-like protein